GGNGILTAASADFSQGGELLIRIPNVGKAGTDCDQLTVTGALTVGGTSNLTLDLTGLTVKAAKNKKITGIVLWGSIIGNQFATTNTINNPGLVVTFTYDTKKNRLDVAFA